MTRSNVRNNIRTLRRAAGLTQEALAGRVGATRQTIIAVEAEKYAPSLDLAFRIALALGRPIGEVFVYDQDGGC